MKIYASPQVAAAPAVVVLLISCALCSNAQTSSADRVATTRNLVRFTPITPSQRFHHYLKRTFGPESWLRTAAGAGWGQGWDRPKEWGEGDAAFGKRFASGYAEHVSETTIEYGLSMAFHEDNRYIKSGEDANGGRLAYALESPFLAHRDDGTRRVSISHITAILGAAVISRQWQPHSTSGYRSAALNATTMFGASMGFDVLREFWPRK